MTCSDIRYIPFPDTWRKRWTIKLSRNYSDDRSSGRNFARGGPAARDISVKFLSSISFLDSFTRKMMERSCREVNHGEGSWSMIDDPVGPPLLKYMRSEDKYALTKFPSRIYGSRSVKEEFVVLEVVRASRTELRWPATGDDLSRFENASSTSSHLSK